MGSQLKKQETERIRTLIHIFSISRYMQSLLGERRDYRRQAPSTTKKQTNLIGKKLTSPAHKTTHSNCTFSMRILQSSSTGKELDAETGYGYHGARYMDYELMTGWLSVDPMADKYPRISPYNYCMWNPIKLLDPDGRDVWEIDKNGCVKNTGDKSGGKKVQTVKYASGVTVTFPGNYYHSILNDLTNTNDYGVSLHNGKSDEGQAMADVFYNMAMNTNVEWRMDLKKDESFIISSKHDVSNSPSALSLRLSFNDLYSTIHSHPSAEDDYTKEIESMGIIRNKDYYGGDYGLRNQQPKSLKSYVFMKNSLRAWKLRPFDNPAIVGDSKRNEVHFSNGNNILELLKL